MRLTVIGCGDAFGSGGRLQTAFLLDTEDNSRHGDGRVLIDCGATVCIGLNRLAIPPASITQIVISHLHGDHFAGLVWFIMQAQYIDKRTRPLTVTGPPGIEGRYIAASEALFPGSTTLQKRFDLTFHEIVPGTPRPVGPLTTEVFNVDHPSGAPSYAVRCTTADRVIAFTGDTQWTDTLVDAGRDADLYIMECYRFRDAPRYHLDWQTIAAKLDLIGARRVLLTHMSDDMLANRSAVQRADVACAEDGLIIEF